MRKRNMPRLCGVAEAAELLGIKKQNIKKTKDLPKPIQMLICGPIWLESEILKYKTDRLKKNYSDNGGIPGA